MCAAWDTETGRHWSLFNKIIKVFLLPEIKQRNLMYWSTFKESTDSFLPGSLHRLAYNAGHTIKNTLWKISNTNTDMRTWSQSHSMPLFKIPFSNIIKKKIEHFQPYTHKKWLLYPSDGHSSKRFIVPAYPLFPWPGYDLFLLPPPLWWQRSPLHPTLSGHGLQSGSHDFVTLGGIIGPAASSQWWTLQGWLLRTQQVWGKRQS